MKTILQDKKECYFCQNQNVEDHHIFFGTSNRKNSEKHGLKVWLCHVCHRDQIVGVHFSKARNLQLRRIAQGKFEETGTREDFIKIFGRNYL